MGRISVTLRQSNMQGYLLILQLEPQLQQIYSKTNLTSVMNFQLMLCVLWPRHLWKRYFSSIPRFGWLMLIFRLWKLVISSNSLRFSSMLWFYPDLCRISSIIQLHMEILSIQTVYLLNKSLWILVRVVNAFTKYYLAVTKLKVAWYFIMRHR